MPLNILDADSSYLHAQAEVEEWATAFLTGWLGPQLDLAKLKMYAELDPLVKENLKQMDPQAWAQFEAEVERIKERYSNGSI